MRFWPYGSDADNRSGSFPFGLDIVALKGFLDGREIVEYGQILSEQVFSEKVAKKNFTEYVTSAYRLGYPLRIQITCTGESPDLHEIVWEALCNPEDNQLLTTDENVWFSRYLPSQDKRPVLPTTPNQIRAVVAASNPDNLTNYKFDPVDVDGEISRAKESIGAIRTRLLPDKQRRVTLKHLIDEIRDGVEIVYLACHGLINDNGEPLLILEDDHGNYCGVKGTELVSEIKKLINLPRLIVLASCESAGKEQARALLALGPLLTQAGVPAVLAMHGKISMETVKDFAPVFFSQIQKDGQIDRALAVARNTIKTKKDFWMPVLYLRSKSGKLWNTESENKNRSEIKNRYNPEIQWQIPYLSNRSDQDAALCAAIESWKHQEMRRPIVSVIQGDPSQCHDMFIEHLKIKTLPKISKFASPLGHDFDISWEGTLYQLDDIETKLKHTLIERLLNKKETALEPVTIEAVQNHLASYEEPVILHCEIRMDEWLKYGPDLIDRFFKFFEKWPNLIPNQKLFIFLLIKYDEVSLSLYQRLQYHLQKRKTTKFLNGDAKNSFEKIIFVPLPELMDIDYLDAKIWAENDACNFWGKDTRLIISKIEEIYQKAKETASTRRGANHGMPMKTLAGHLNKLLIQYSR